MGANAIIVGGGHNGLVAAIILARAGMNVTVLEQKSTVGGAAKTERPFAKAPGLGGSTGAYLLGLPPPELLADLDIDVPVLARDPHYFVPTTDGRYLLAGQDQTDLEKQFRAFFSDADWVAYRRLNNELTALRDDLAPSWLKPPLTLEETADRFIRPALQQVFIDLCRGSIAAYLDRFAFRSDLILGMFAVTDGFSGLSGGWDSPGTGQNFLFHNMCRLPEANGTWMIVKGGMGAFTQLLATRARAWGATIRTDARVQAIELEGDRIAGVFLDNDERIAADVVVSNADPFTTRSLVEASGAALPTELSSRLDAMRVDGSTFKLNLAFERLPTFSCLKEQRGQHRCTTHLLPDEGTVIDTMRTSHAQMKAGELPDFPLIEWYFHTTVDPSIQDDAGRHNGALFVQWVPYQLADTTWDEAEPRFVDRLVSLCERFAPDVRECIADSFPLSPRRIESHFGIARGHIHHVDNAFGFDQRAPHRFGCPGLYSCSAGTHPAGAVIGAAGHNAAHAVLADSE